MKNKNKCQMSGIRCQGKKLVGLHLPGTWNLELGTSPGFTLVETLAAVTLLAIAIVAPMLLTVQSLTSAYYARDEITASYLAQEALEAIHQIRDDQILTIAETPPNSNNPIDLFGPLEQYATGQPFTIDATNDQTSACSGTCPVLQTGPFQELYGYQAGHLGTWTNTAFTRTVTICYVQPSSGCNATASDEVRVTATVSWQTASLNTRTITVSEDLYRWIQDGSGT